MAGVVATVRLDGGGKCAEARLVLFGVGDKPVRAKQAEASLSGASLAAAQLEEAGKIASEEIGEPLSDVHAPAEYRRDLARVLARRALAEALERATNLGGSAEKP